MPCHSLGFVHLDITPRNILVTVDTALLMDYDCVCQIGEVPRGPNSGKGKRDNPQEMCVYGSSLYIADMNNHRRVWSRRIIHSQHRCRQGDGQVFYPSGVCVSGDLIYVADFGNHRISLDGHFVHEGSGEGELNSPCGMCAVDDLLFVADAANSRVCVWPRSLFGQAVLQSQRPTMARAS